MIEIQITEHGVECTLFDKSGGVVSTTRYQSEDNLPRELRAKISVLRLVGDKQSVEDVGQKISDSLYWIFEEIEPQLADYWVAYLMGMATARQVSLKSVIRKTDKYKESNNDSPRDVRSDAKHNSAWRDIYRSKRGGKY